MERKLSPWCKQAKIALIEKDWSTADLAEAIGMAREYTSAVVNGRVYSASAIKAISDVLNIQETAYSTFFNQSIPQEVGD